MADFSKMKKKSLGIPPAFEETKGNLEAPEVAPSDPNSGTSNNSPARSKKASRPKSKRTAKLTTSLTPEFKKKLQMMSLDQKKDMGEIIEEAVLYWHKNK